MRIPRRFAAIFVALTLWLCAVALAADPDIFQLINKGDVTGVALALKHNPALIKAKDGHGRTPLTRAIQARQDEIAKFLVAKGSPLTAFDAAALGETSILREMVAANPALLKVKDGGGVTLLMWAAFRHHRETVEMLVAQGAPMDIYAAAALGLTDKVKEFIAADPRTLVGQGPAEMTALQVAVGAGSFDAAKLLLDKGADPNSVPIGVPRCSTPPDVVTPT